MSRSIVAACSAALALSAAAQAQVVELTPPAEDQMREGYEPTRLSRSTLVSARIGAPDDTSAARLSVVIPNPRRGAAPSNLCVSSNSRDGLFWSRHTYEPASAAQAWRAPALSYRYTRELSDYVSGDILVIARYGDAANCIEDPVHLPIVLNPAGDLLIELNSSDRTVEAVLRAEDGAEIAGRCSRSSGPPLISDTVCRFAPQLGFQGGLVTLDVTLDNFPFDQARETFAFYLPAEADW